MKREEILFLIITFSFSWFFFLIPLTLEFNTFTILLFSLIGLFGPSVAALFISYFVYNDQSVLKIEWKKFLLLASFLYYITFSWIFWIYINANIYFPSPPRIIYPLMIFISLLSSFTFLNIMKNPKGVINKNSLFKIKGQVQWIVMAIGIPVLIGFTTYLFLPTDYPDDPLNYMIENPNYVIFSVLFLFFLNGAVSEELGWRGYLTPNLLKRYSPLITGLIVGIIWSTWHIPLYINGNYFVTDIWRSLLYRYYFNVPLGVIMTWIYIKTDFNLLVAMFFHTSFNFIAIYNNEYSVILYYVVTIIMIIESKMGRKSETVNVENETELIEYSKDED